MTAEYIPVAVYDATLRTQKETIRDCKRYHAYGNHTNSINERDSPSSWETRGLRRDVG
jgi:hypothetical protein